MASWEDCLAGSGALGQSLQRSWMEDSTALCLGDGDLPLPKPIRSTTLAVNLRITGECRLKRQAKKQESSYRAAYERVLFLLTIDYGAAPHHICSNAQ
jgi:hypothetical protein